MAGFGLEAFPVTTQTYPRKQDWLVLNALAGLAGSLYKFAFDVRILQSQPFGEWSEPFGSLQVGSSAMPFKRNPVHAENLDSLARLVAALTRVAWDNAAHSLLERTLDDKANRRFILPQAFLISEELLRRAGRILRGLEIYDGAVARNLAVLWCLCRRRATVDGIGQGRGRSPGHARSDPGAQPDRVGCDPAARRQPRPAG